MKIYNNFDLTNYNSFRLSSIAKIIYFPESITNLIQILKQNLEIPILADGTNVLLHSEIEELICLKFMKEMIYPRNKIVITTANYPLQKLINYTIQNNLSGLESLWGIPGRVGSAIYMNSGSVSSYISDYLQKVLILTKNGKIETINKKNIKFSRRHSIFQNTKDIILEATFKFEKQQIDNEKLLKAKKWRKSFPKEPNVGGVFKNWYALKPYEKELRELKLNNISFANHINILINTGDATFVDVMDAIDKIRKVVKEPLELEAQII